MAHGALRRARGSARSAKIKDREKDRGETPKPGDKRRRELAPVQRQDGRKGPCPPWRTTHAPSISRNAAARRSSGYEIGVPKYIGADAIEDALKGL